MRHRRGRSSARCSYLDPSNFLPGRASQPKPGHAVCNGLAILVRGRCLMDARRRICPSHASLPPLRYLLSRSQRLFASKQQHPDRIYPGSNR